MFHIIEWSDFGKKKPNLIGKKNKKKKNEEIIIISLIYNAKKDTDS